MKRVSFCLHKVVFFVLSTILLLPLVGTISIKAAEYTVTYYVKSYGQDNWSIYDSIATINDGEIVLPTEPDLSNSNYGDYKSFLGWSIDSTPDEDSALVDLSTKINGNLDLYAVMSTSYKIDYRYSVGGDLIMYKLVPEGMSYPRPSEPELANANFTIASNQYFENTWQKPNGTEIQFGVDLVHENATLLPIFSDAVWISFDLQGGNVGGLGIDPIKIKKGSAFTDVNLPLVTNVSKTGSLPLHWSLTSSGSEIPEHYIFNSDTTLFTVYTSEEGVPYQIVYWVEKPNLGVNFSPRPGNPAHYDYGYAVTIGGFGMPGQTIGGPGSGADIIISSIPSYNYFDVEDPMRWAQWQETEPATIEADASTIVNVYCTLRVYRIIFEITDATDPGTGLPVGRYMEYDRDKDGTNEIYNQSTPYSFDFKFGDKISSKWPHPVNGAVFHHESDEEYSHWEHPSLAVISGVWQTPRADITAAMMPASPNATGYVVTLAWTAPTGEIGMLYWGELLEGQMEDDSIVKREYNGIWWALLSDYSATIPDTAPDIASKAIPGFQAGIQGDFSDTPTGQSYSSTHNENNQWHSYVNHYYLRVKSNLYYNMEGHGTANLTDAGIPYSTSIAPQNLPGFEDIAYGTSMAAFNVSVDDVAGWRFLGWYVDAAGTLPFDFTTTMPANDLTLFAKWESTDLTVTFMDSDGSTLLGTQGVQMYGKIKFNNLTFDGNRYIINEYNDPNKGALIGWEYIPYSNGVRVPFDTSSTLWRNETLYAVWQNTGLTVMYHNTTGSVLEVDDGANDAGYNLGVIIPTRDDNGVTCSGTSSFVGWRIDGTGAVYNEGDNLTVIGNLHMYPYCANQDADLSDLNYVENEGYLIQYVDGYGTVILSYVALENDFIPQPSSSDLSSAGFVYPGDKYFEETWSYRGTGTEVNYSSDRVSGNLILEPILYDAATIFFTTYSTPTQAIKVKLGTTFGENTLPDISSFSRTGYHPVGWSLDPGDALSNPNNPTNDLIDPNAMIDTDTINLYLKWEGDPNIAYHITYWVEKPNLGANFTPTPGNINHYDIGYIDPTTYYGTAGYTVGGPGSAADIIIASIPDHTTFDDNDPMHWALWQTTMPTTIAGDGSTVVNVYASLKKYTITFNLNESNRTLTIGGVVYGGKQAAGHYKMEFKFGQNLEDIYPHPSFATVFKLSTGLRFYSWDNKGLSLYAVVSGLKKTIQFATPRFVADAGMMPYDWDSQGYTVTLSTTTAAFDGAVYWLEALPDQDCDNDPELVCKIMVHPVTNQPVTYVYAPTHTGTGTVNATWNHKEIYGFTPVEDLFYKAACEVPDPNEAFQLPANCVNLFYDRVRATFSYDLRGHDSALSTQLASENPPRDLAELTGTLTLMYGQDLSKLDIDLPDILNSTGDVSYRFKYWSSVSELTYPFNFNQTMPVNNIIVYALYESTDHTVTFRDGDGTPLASDGSDRQGVSDGATIRFENLTIGGTLYIPGETFDGQKGFFLGWQIKEEGTGNLVDFHNNTPIYTNVTLYAKWQTSGLSVVYHNSDYSVLYSDTGDNGNGYMVGTQVVIQDNSDPNLSALNIPSGASFLGWRVNGTGLVYVKDSLLAIDGVMHLYPLFQYTNYPLKLNAVKFISNTGASGSAVGDEDNDGIADLGYNVVNGNNFYLPQAALLPEFKKEGKVLKGWSTTPDPEDPEAELYAPGEEVIATKALSFYAVYGDALRVTYHDNTDDAVLDVPMDEWEYLEGEVVYVKFSIDETYFYNGRTYAFVGWSTNPLATSVQYSSDGLNHFVINDNTDLYAIWEVSYKVIYDGNGYTGAVPIDNTPHFYDDKVDVLFDINKTYALAESLEYFVFKGWDEDPKATVPAYIAADINFFHIEKDTTLYAIWGPAYLVTYNGNGYTGVVPVDAALYQPLVNVAVRYGFLSQYISHDNRKYVFKGWSEDPEASEPTYTSAGLSQFAINQHTTLYAVWQPLYHLSYNGNGYLADFEDPNDYNPNDLAEVNFNRTEDFEDEDFRYEFLGWDKDPDAVDPMYTADGVTTLEMQGDTTLYAIYKVTPKHASEDREEPPLGNDQPSSYSPQNPAVPLTGMQSDVGRWWCLLWFCGWLFWSMLLKRED